MLAGWQNYTFSSRRPNLDTMEGVMLNWSCHVNGIINSSVLNKAKFFKFFLFNEFIRQLLKSKTKVYCNKILTKSALPSILLLININLSSLRYKLAFSLHVLDLCDNLLKL